MLWEYTYSSSTYRTHHDIAPMPNGNVLLIAWEVKTPRSGNSGRTESQRINMA
ncbi:MAG: hypothetical protein IPI04_18590 [Ignavibacteria bacterium]|nr:hypothetical protein [Ignavibacteria bacterium]